MKQLLRKSSAGRKGTVRFEIQNEEQRGFQKGLRTACDLIARRVFPLLSLLAVAMFAVPAAAQITGGGTICTGTTTTVSDATPGGTWSSSNTAIAVVDPSTGIVTGVSAGTATISYNAAVTVETIVISINAAPTAPVVTGGNGVCILSSFSLSSPTDGGVWSVTNAIATVTTSGVVTGNAIGADTVNYTVTNNCGSTTTATKVTINGIVGDMYTYGGTGTAGFTGDGVPAFQTEINQPRDLTTDAAGNVYFCDVANNRVRKITRDGFITTVAGNGTAGNLGDGGPATAANLNGPNGVFVDNAGNIFISNTSSHTIKKVNTSGIITTIAGVAGSAGSTDGAATAAKFNLPLGVLEDVNGDVYVSDQNNNKIRKITMSTGTVSTVAGTGTAGYSGDNGPATAAQFHTVRGITQDNKGSIYIADAFNNVIRKFIPSTGIITTFAGDGTPAHTGDGGPATAAEIDNPARFAYDGANILYITDQTNDDIRQINLATGIISSVAGNTTAGYGGDFGAATSAELNIPAGIAVDFFGNFFIADANNSRIRVVPSSGSILSTLTGPPNICAGTPISLNSFLSGSGSAVYTWQKNGVDVGSGTPYTNNNPANGDVYRVIVTVTPTCGTPFNDTSNNITISVSPKVSAISGTDPICIGETVSLTDTAAGGTWSAGNTAVATITSGGQVTGISSGTSIITYSLPNVCGSNSANITLTVNALDTVAASSAANGSISPNGTVTVCSNGSQTFNITPSPGYHVVNVTVDGESVGAVTSYTFSEPTGNHTIVAAAFAPDCVTPSITATTAGSVCGSGTVALSATASAGTINWYTGPTGGTSINTGGSYSPSVSSTTTYYVDATDGSCISSRTAIAATVNSNPTASTSVTNVTCNGGSNGSVTVTGAGGAPAYTVSGSATTGLSAGSYSYTVTDANGCTASTSATVTAPSAVTASATAGSISCNGGTTTVYVTGGGGTGTLTGTGTYTVNAGSYSYTVTDANGCSATASGSVTQPSAVTASATAGSISCNGGTTTVYVTGGGGTGTLTGTGTYTVNAGSYSYTVTDANGCSATASGSVTQPAAVTASATAGSISCHGGTATVSITGTGGTGTLTGTGSYSVSAGAYSYTVTDANGCSATASGSITQPTAVTASATAGSISCNGGTTTVSITGAGGTGTLTGTGSYTVNAGPYSYAVTDANGCSATAAGTISQPSSITVSASAGSISCHGGTTTVTVTASGGTGTLTGTGTFTASAGAHSYTVTDANGCSATASITITEPTQVTASATTGTIACHGGATTVNVTGGGGTGTLSGTGIFSVNAGSYSYVVTDANGCSATTSGSISQPSSLTLSGSVTNVACHGGTTGAISASVGGGTPSYTYSWSTDAGGSSISGLTAGTYSVTVTDANSCSITGSYTVAQPATALSVTGSVTNVNCNGGSTGAITASVSGGTSSYTYSWSNGATTSSISGLSAGSYSVAVTDAHSCTTTGSYTVTQPSSPVSVSGSVTNVSCYGGATGAVSTTPTGGTTPYTCSWNCGGATTSLSSKAAGSYAVTVTDAHGCTTTGTFSVSQPAAALSVSGTVTNVGCSGGSTGSIVTTVTGGTSSYTYAWSTGATTSGASSLATGTYSVTVTDAHGCTTAGSYTVTQPAGVSCSVSGNSSVLGTVTSTYTAPTGMSGYSWTVSGGGASISGSSSSSSVNISTPCSAGVFTVAVTVSNSGCSSTCNKAVTITASAKITTYSCLYSTGDGHHPSVDKGALCANLKVYDRHICGPQDGIQSHYSTVWSGSTGQITNCSISSPITTYIGGGPVNQYTITVPAGGHYLVVGKCTIPSSYYFGGNCTLYTAQKCGGYDVVDGDDYTNDDTLTPCNTPINRYHYCLQDNYGVCSEACTQEEHGSLLLIISPMALTYDDSIENLPVIYESIEGEWGVAVSADPPDGFYSIPADTLATSVADSTLPLNAVQFYVADTGSVWTNTKLTHNIQHKGAARTAYSSPKMVNARTNKVTEVSIYPNPTSNNINIVLPKFEGKATVRVYNMLGQKVAEKKINIDGGVSVSMDVSTLPPGAYLVAVENSYSRATGRLLKQ